MANTAQLGSDSDSSGDDRGAGAPAGGRAAWRFARELVIIVLAALLVAFLIKTFLIRSFFIPSASMEDTLMGGPGSPVNDRIIVNELVPRLMPAQRGDIVVFKDPGGWLTTEPGDDLVKRVIGVPGDHVVCCNALNQITVNGTALKEPYVRLINPGDPPAAKPFDVVVPAGELWVMGDNRQNSEDSSYHYSAQSPSSGFVPEKNVIGRAIVISWPVSRWRWLSNYPSVFDGVK